MRRMNVRLNDEPLKEFDCFKYMWSQVAADAGCEGDLVYIINQGINLSKIRGNVCLHTENGVVIVTKVF